MAFWDKIKSRGNVEDRRAAGPLAIGGLGSLGTFGIALVIIFAVLGGDPNSLNDVLGQLQPSQATQQGIGTEFAGEDSYETFASTIVGSNNDLWRSIFAQSNKAYIEPKLVLFRSLTQSGCGIASSQVGPHYCPADKTIYLDETFFDELKQRFGARGGDVAEAYVIAHEVAHHAQNELGIMEQTRAGQSNEDSIKLELQADCFAGVWAYSVSHLGIFEPGEIQEALDAAAAVGDDRVQQSAGAEVNPETWTHGSSEDRTFWFNKGYETGKPAECNTFQ